MPQKDIITEMENKEWDEYHLEMFEHEKYYSERKPLREKFESEEDFKKAYREWDMSKSMNEPNKPGYYRANND
jgi:hypothetical protein